MRDKVKKLPEEKNILKVNQLSACSQFKYNNKLQFECGALLPLTTSLAVDSFCFFSRNVFVVATSDCKSDNNFFFF